MEVYNFKILHIYEYRCSQLTLIMVISVPQAAQIDVNKQTC